jgi:hypothetical protein
VAAYEDLHGHHLLAVRNLIATTNDKSYHGSANELPPQPHTGMPSGTSPVCRTRMFQQFLNAVDYRFGCSDDSSTGRYDPARECFVVVVDDQADDANGAGAGD